MSEESSYFTRLLETGEFRVDADGTATLYGSPVMFFPPRVMARLHHNLRVELGEEEARDLLRDLGEYQVVSALEKNEERYGLDGIGKEKLGDFATNLYSILGIGRAHVLAFSYGDNTFRIGLDNPTIAESYREQYGETDAPVCHYLEGLIGLGFAALIGGDIEVEEAKCAATGAERCEFVGRPA